MSVLSQVVPLHLFGEGGETLLDDHLDCGIQMAPLSSLVNDATVHSIYAIVLVYTLAILYAERC